MQWNINTNHKYKKRCNIRYISNDALPKRSQVTSILVFAFTEIGEIVVTVNQRGVDIPGWHLEDIDNTFEDAAYRETLEETGVEIEGIIYFWKLESDYFWSKENELTYILLYATKIKKINNYNWNLESSGRKIISHIEFLNQYHWKVVNKELMKFLLEKSYKVLN
jgi:8-oxo-dGTP pyrophosphatase MutT (NUDIX family)